MFNIHKGNVYDSACHLSYCMRQKSKIEEKENKMFDVINLALGTIEYMPEQTENSIVKIGISAQRKCRSTKSLSLEQFFMLFSLPVLLTLRESSISNNFLSKFLVIIWKNIFFVFFHNFTLKYIDYSCTMSRNLC